MDKRMYRRTDWRMDGRTVSSWSPPNLFGVYHLPIHVGVLEGDQLSPSHVYSKLSYDPSTRYPASHTTRHVMILSILLKKQDAILPLSGRRSWSSSHNTVIQTTAYLSYVLEWVIIERYFTKFTWMTSRLHSIIYKQLSAYTCVWFKQYNVFMLPMLNKKLIISIFISSIFLFWTVIFHSSYVLLEQNIQIKIKLLKFKSNKCLVILLKSNPFKLNNWKVKSNMIK